MKIFIATYYWTGPFSSFQEYSYVVVAETEEVALGLVLEAQPDTRQAHWSFTEIQQNIAKSHYINERCS